MGGFDVGLDQDRPDPDRSREPEPQAAQPHRTPAAETASTAPPTWPGRTVLVAIGLYVLLFSSLTILRHAGLNSSGFDLAIQDQVLWNTAHGRWFQGSVEVESFFGDHVSLIALLLAPLVWLPGLGVEWLLIFQSLALGISAWPLYRLAKLEAKSPLWSVALPVAFLLYPVLGFVNRFDFHFVALAIPALMWMLLFLRERRLWPAAACALLAVMCREEVGLAVAGAAVYAMFHRRTRRWGLVVAPAAVLWSVVALMVVIPHFRGGPSDTLGRYLWLGDSPASIVAALLTRPGQVVKHLLDDPIRIKTLLFLIWPLLFLPIFAPQRLLCAVVPLLIVQLPDHASMNSIYFQYLAPVVPLLWWAAVRGAVFWEGLLARLKADGRLSWLGPAGLLGCVGLAFCLENPVFKMVDDPCWRVQAFPRRPNVEEFRQAVELIGPADSVAATLAFAPHLARRSELGVIGFPGPVTRPEFIIVDLSDFRWLGQTSAYAEFLARIIQSPQYGVRYWANDVVLLQRDQESRFDRAEVLAALHENARRHYSSSSASSDPPGTTNQGN